MTDYQGRGETLGLFSPNGVAQSIVSFGPQSQNISQGRFPDGNTNASYTMTNWTPRLPNSLAAPAAPQFGGVTLIDATTLRFNVNGTPNRAYRIDYKDQLSDPLWKPLSTNRLSNGAITINDRTTNSPQRFYRIILLQ